MPAPLNHPPYAGCEKGGRPKKYTQEFIENEADALEEWMKTKDNLFYENFAFERGYSYKRLTEWAKENEKFSDTYERSRTRQKGLLLIGGLMKKFNYNMCALILGRSYGMTAKTKQKISGDAVNPLAFILQSIDGNTKDLIPGENAE